MSSPKCSIVDDQRFVSVVVKDASSGQVFVDIEPSRADPAQTMQRAGAVEHEGQLVGSFTLRMSLLPYRKPTGVSRATTWGNWRSSWACRWR